MNDTVSYLAESSHDYLDEHHHAPATAALLALHQTVAVAVQAALATRAVAAAARHALAIAGLEAVRAEGAAREAAALAVVALDASVTETVLALLHVLGVGHGDTRGVLGEHRGRVHRNVPRLGRNAIVVAIQLESIHPGETT